MGLAPAQCQAWPGSKQQKRTEFSAERLAAVLRAGHGRWGAAEEPSVWGTRWAQPHPGTARLLLPLLRAHFLVLTASYSAQMSLPRGKPHKAVSSHCDHNPQEELHLTQMAEINVPPSETVPYHLKSTLIFLLFFYFIKGEIAKKGAAATAKSLQSCPTLCDP